MTEKNQTQNRTRFGLGGGCHQERVAMHIQCDTDRRQEEVHHGFSFLQGKICPIPTTIFFEEF